MLSDPEYAQYDDAVCVVGYQGRLGHGDMKDQYTPRQVRLLSTATIVLFHTFVWFRAIACFPPLFVTKV